MVQILIPIFATSAATTIIGSYYLGGVAETVATVDSLGVINDESVRLALLPIQVTTSALMTYITALLNNQVSLTGEIKSLTDSVGNSLWFSSLVEYFNTIDQENFFNNVFNLFSVLLIIRMSKLIGNDRDSIIAEKIQAAAKDYPVRF